MKLISIRRQLSEQLHRDLEKNKEATTEVSYMTLIKLGKAVMILLLILILIVGIPFVYLSVMMFGGGIIYTILGDTPAASTGTSVLNVITIIAIAAIGVSYLYAALRRDR